MTTAANTPRHPKEGSASGILAPEEAMLFLAAAPGTSGAAAARLASEGLEWRRLGHLADAEGASGPLLRSLRRMHVTVPAELVMPMESLAAVSSFRLMHVRRLLERTVGALVAEGIEVMLVKGAALAPFVYANFDERNMADLDIIVPVESAQRAQRLALGMGWLPGPPEAEAAGYESHHHLPPLHDGEGVDVRLEIHTDAFPTGQPLKYNLKQVRARSRKASFAGGEVIIPSAEDLLLYSCVHLAWSHEMRIGGWKTFRDVSEIVGHADFSWERFLALATEPTVATSAYWTLRLSASASGVLVPSYVLDALRPGLPNWLLGVVERHFLLQLTPLRSGSPSVSLTRLIWSIGMRPRLSGHGGVRPWQVAEQRRAGTRAPGETPWWLKTAGYRDAFSYLSRLIRPVR